MDKYYIIQDSNNIYMGKILTISIVKLALIIKFQVGDGYYHVLFNISKNVFMFDIILYEIDDVEEFETFKCMLELTS